MKTFINSALPLFFIFLVSCQSEEFLREIPRDRITADNLYTSADGFENGLNALYAMVRNERINFADYDNMPVVLATGGTDAYYMSRFAARDNAFVQWGSYMNPSLLVIDKTWSWLYTIINAANTIIDRAENPEINWGTANKKQETVAQAKCIRAWAYRHLVNLWGDVPLTLNESTGANIKTDWTREPKVNVLKAMASDWLFAEQNLPEIQSVPGRLNKAVPRHYLSELYLLTGEDVKAEQMAKAVITSGKFKLITERYGSKKNLPGVPFMDQFYTENVFYKNGNTEVLWEMPHSRDVVGGGGNIMRRTWMVRYDTNPGMSASAARGRGTGFMSATKYALSLYEPKDDRNSMYAIHKFIIKDNGDTLFTTTQGKTEPNVDNLWPCTRKWDDGDPTNVGRNEGYNNQPYLRLAETYLLLAEAQFKQGKLTEAAESLNTVRRRSKASEITAAQVSIDFILDERIRELLTEEHRRYTLLRLGKWLSRTKLYNKQAGTFVTERDQLYPIPQSVIDANLDLKMPQNAGY